MYAIGHVCVHSFMWIKMPVLADTDQVGSLCTSETHLCWQQSVPLPPLARQSEWMDGTGRVGRLRCGCLCARSCKCGEEKE